MQSHKFSAWAISQASLHVISMKHQTARKSPEDTFTVNCQSERCTLHGLQRFTSHSAMRASVRLCTDVGAMTPGSQSVIQFTPTVLDGVLPHPTGQTISFKDLTLCPAHCHVETGKGLSPKLGAYHCLILYCSTYRTYCIHLTCALTWRVLLFFHTGKKTECRKERGSVLKYNAEGTETIFTWFSQSTTMGKLPQ